MRSVLLTTTFLVALTSSSYAKVIDRIVAVVNDDVVTLSELQDGVKVRLAAVDGITNPEEKARQTKIIMSRGLDDMIGKRLIRQEAARDVAARELSSGHQSSIVNGHAVVRLVALPEAS